MQDSQGHASSSRPPWHTQQTTGSRASLMSRRILAASVCRNILVSNQSAIRHLIAPLRRSPWAFSEPICEIFVLPMDEKGISGVVGLFPPKRSEDSMTKLREPTLFNGMLRASQAVCTSAVYGLVDSCKRESWWYRSKHHRAMQNNRDLIFDFLFS